MTEPTKCAPTIIRRDEVTAKTGLPRSSIYDRVKAGTFPAPIRLGVGAKAVGWVSSEIDDWIAEQIKNSRAAA
ncbi:helix-turn-helix transcriptional regulator [Azonexus hydrophilus]|uniref:helix-turn-helix transcriptional regulator n=1 Tax=Azonexus hydrophilus TaxID=418702 RepID=UPI001965B14F|nr:AlpA family transcriptional regulator [Azonexus hydrophilus]